jgi:hypothetical protein
LLAVEPLVELLELRLVELLALALVAVEPLVELPAVLPVEVELLAVEPPELRLVELPAVLLVEVELLALRLLEELPYRIYPWRQFFLEASLKAALSRAPLDSYLP